MRSGSSLESPARVYTILTGTSAVIGGGFEGTVEAFYAFIDAALEGREAEFDPGRIPRQNRNANIIEMIGSQPIIIEQSPAIGEAFTDVLKTATSVRVGTYVGYRTGGDNPILMFVTVPLGIIVVGSSGFLGVRIGAAGG
jgi:hypothetical protein